VEAIKEGPEEEEDDGNRIALLHLITLSLPFPTIFKHTVNNTIIS
jgi:hypothetical protein